MVCFHFRHALLSFMSRHSSQLHPFLESLATPQATHPLSTARLSFINASLRQEGAACGLEKSHLSAGLYGMDAKFALSSVQLSSLCRLHIGGEMINCCGSCSLCASRAVWIPPPPVSLTAIHTMGFLSSFARKIFSVWERPHDGFWQVLSVRMGVERHTAP